MYQLVKNKMVLIHEQIIIIFLELEKMIIKCKNTMLSLTIKIEKVNIILIDKKG